MAVVAARNEPLRTPSPLTSSFGDHGEVAVGRTHEKDAEAMEVARRQYLRTNVGKHALVVNVNDNAKTIVDILLKKSKTCCHVPHSLGGQVGLGEAACTLVVTKEQERVAIGWRSQNVCHFCEGSVSSHLSRA